MKIQNISTLLSAFILTVFSSQMGHAANDISGIVPPPVQDSKVLALVDNLKLPEAESYEASVPDTLDLAERCRIAVKGMSWSVSDTEYDHEPYAWIIYDHRTPHAWFGNGLGLVSSPKYAEVLPILRCASGSVENLKIEEGQK